MSDEQLKQELFTAAQLEALNSIITSRLTSVKNTVESMRVNAEDNHKALLAAIQQTPAKGKTKDAAEEEDQEKLTLKQQLAILVEDKRANEAKEREQSLLNEVKQHLAKNGINARADLLLPVIRKDIEVNKLTGKVEMKIQGLSRPIEEGLELFAQSETGMFYRDPVGVNGVGNSATTNTGGGGSTIPQQTKELLRDPTKATANNYLNLDQMKALITGNRSDLKL